LQIEEGTGAMKMEGTTGREGRRREGDIPLVAINADAVY
jgi:hypothetical protein